MSVYSDLDGKRFTRLLAISFTGAKDGSGNPLWLFRCDCGKEKVIAAHCVKRGSTKSCGCLNAEVRRTIKGPRPQVSKSPPGYKSWLSMRDRCLRKNNVAYRLYGGRGITICERWNSFENFISDMGPKPEGTSLDRINNDGNYETSNCRWATAIQQGRNRRPVIKVTVNGITKYLSEWADEIGMRRKTMWRRYAIAGLRGKELLQPHRWIAKR